MKIKEIKEQFHSLLKDELINHIDTNILIRSHPNYPIVENIVLNPHDNDLDDNQVDELFDGNTVVLRVELEGTYDKLSKNENLRSVNNYFVFKVNELTIAIEENELIIIEVKGVPFV